MNKPATRRPFKQQPWRSLRNPYRPTTLLSLDQIEAIHEASLTILEEVGMDFLLREAREILAGAGAAVDRSSARVKFDRGLILEAISSAPSEFTLHARNSAHDLTIGGDHINFCSVAGAAHAADCLNKRRAGTFQDFEHFISAHAIRR